MSKVIDLNQRRQQLRQREPLSSSHLPNSKLGPTRDFNDDAAEIKERLARLMLALMALEELRRRFQTEE